VGVNASQATPVVADRPRTTKSTKARHNMTIRVYPRPGAALQ
jgi:hypothetical protein